MLVFGLGGLGGLGGLLSSWCRRISRAVGAHALSLVLCGVTHHAHYIPYLEGPLCAWESVTRLDTNNGT